MSTIVQLAEEARPYQKAAAANVVSATFPSRVPTIAEPTGGAVMDLATSFFWVPVEMLILPYGLGSDNDAFDMRLYGWHHIGNVSPTTQVLWVPALIATFTCTICAAAPGVTLAPVIATEFFCDTIVLKSAVTQPLQTDQNATPATQFRGNDLTIASPADNASIGWIRTKLLGFEKIEFTFDTTTGTPSMNCLVAKL